MRQPFDLLLASNGAEALSHMREKRPDLDSDGHGNFEINGLEILRRLKPFHRFYDIPVMVVSV